MLKVLVADENINQVRNCCNYISNYDSDIQPIGANTGVETLTKYNQMKADILVLNSHFKDLNSTEILNKLSSTTNERKNSNIIMTVNTKKEQSAFIDVAKIYKFLYKPLDLEQLSNTINQIKSDNRYTELTENYLNQLLYSMKITVGAYQTEILKDAIIECYNYPYLLSDFDSVLSLLSIKYNLSNDAIRTAIRFSLKNLNKYVDKLTSHPIVKVFESDKNITPKNFLQVVVSYIHANNGQEIFF